MDDRTDYLVEQLTARLAAVQAAEASLAATAQRIPRSVPLNVFENWRSTVGFTLGPVLLVLLALLLDGHFARVPKAELEAVHAENAHIRDQNAQLARIGRFYRDQGQAYRKKFPKAAPYFPPYVAPVANP